MKKGNTGYDKYAVSSQKTMILAKYNGYTENKPGENQTAPSLFHYTLKKSLCRGTGPFQRTPISIQLLTLNTDCS